MLQRNVLTGCDHMLYIAGITQSKKKEEKIFSKDHFLVQTFIILILSMLQHSAAIANNKMCYWQLSLKLNIFFLCITQYKNGLI